jgi:hypothetical protein
MPVGRRVKHCSSRGREKAESNDTSGTALLIGDRAGQRVPTAIVMFRILGRLRTTGMRSRRCRRSRRRRRHGKQPRREQDQEKQTHDGGHPAECYGWGFNSSNQTGRQNLLASNSGRDHHRETVQLLAGKITDRLKEHKSCTIFQADLDRVWPVGNKERQLREQRLTLIEAFARSHGWSVTIRDPGIRVIFRKLEPGAAAEASNLAKAG